MKTLVIRQFGTSKPFLIPFAFLLFTSYFLLVLPARAQEDIPANAAAPPIKALTTDDKKKLEAETDVKKRYKLALDMMEIRMKNAETFFAEEDFYAMFAEFGFFHALMDNTLAFLDRHNIGSGKILDYYKRFEMSLREFISRIEVIRRELPPRFEYYVRTLVKAVRDGRTRAVEPLFSDTVVPNQQQQ